MADAGRLAWMLRPIAHRGLHAKDRNVIENSASAIDAAIRAGYAIEVDLQAARDSVPIVFHDATLDRLTGATGRVDAHPSSALRSIKLSGTEDRILSLQDLLDRVDGRVPLIIEIKTGPRRNRRFEAAIAEALLAYRGDAAIMSFDPRTVAAFRRLAPSIPRGLIAERFDDPAHWPGLTPLRRFAMRNLLTGVIARPNFIAYHVKALPAAAPRIARKLGLPLLTWTVRDEAEAKHAGAHADAIIFEGFEPAAKL